MQTSFIFQSAYPASCLICKSSLDVALDASSFQLHSLSMLQERIDLAQFPLCVVDCHLQLKLSSLKGEERRRREEIKFMIAGKTLQLCSKAFILQMNVEIFLETLSSILNIFICNCKVVKFSMSSECRQKLTLKLFSFQIHFVFNLWIIYSWYFSWVRTSL